MIILQATHLQPFFMGIIVALCVGYVLTSPLSSTALCIMLDLSGIAAGAGIGICGFVGQIFTFTEMGLSITTFIQVLLLHIILPAALSLFFDWCLRKKGKIKDGDYYLDL